MTKRKAFHSQIGTHILKSTYHSNIAILLVIFLKSRTNRWLMLVESPQREGRLGLFLSVVRHKDSTRVIWREDGVWHLHIQLANIWSAQTTMWHAFDILHYFFLEGRGIPWEIVPLHCIGRRLFCSWVFVHHSCESWLQTSKMDTWV